MENYFAEIPNSGAKMIVCGAGGGGSNAVDNMINNGLDGVDFMVMNTDAQALASSKAPVKIQIGYDLTKGLGAGGDPEVGMQAAVHSMEEIEDNLKGADLVFITCGLGGGTGTGAAPVIASAAKAQGALTVGVVTMPFLSEGRKRLAYAEAGLKYLKENVDSYIIIPNEKIKQVMDKSTQFLLAFKYVDDVLRQAVQGISDSINTTSLMNVDFNDVRTIMSTRGKALMGLGLGEGDDRATHAVRHAVNSPLLQDVNLTGARGVLYHIAAGEDFRMDEYDMITTEIYNTVGDDAHIIHGVNVSPELTGTIKVTVIATGLHSDAEYVKQHTTDIDNQSINNLNAKQPELQIIERVRKPATNNKAVRTLSDFNEFEFETPTYIRKQL